MVWGAILLAAYAAPAGFVAGEVETSRIYLISGGECDPGDRISRPMLWLYAALWPLADLHLWWRLRS